MILVSTRQTLLIIAIVLVAIVFAVPNVMPQSWRDALPSWWPSSTITLGLDLQGGSYLLLEVDMAAVETERLEQLADDIRQTFAQARVPYVGLGRQDRTVQVEVIEPARMEEARTLLNELSRPAGGGLFGAAGSQYAISEDGARFTLRFSDAALAQKRVSTLEQSIEIVRRRIDELGTREPTIQRQGSDRILVQVPGLDDPERLKELLGRTAKLTFHKVNTRVSVQEALEGRKPPRTEVLPFADDPNQRLLLEFPPVLTGENLVNARQDVDPQAGNQPVVAFELDADGRRRFGQFTRDHVSEPFAIVLDGQIITAPTIRTPITEGRGQISGSFTIQTANDLAILLNAGALPAPLNVVEERTVGAELGADAVAAGQISALVGLSAVFVFMLLGYGLFGVFANLALIVNIILTLAIMTALDATLTLPGIAGLILSVALSVDANVLIYERMREEALAGRPAISAMDAGFRRALGTIIDTNLTTILAVALMFMFGSGPVRGFAVTLIVGVLCSMFTAVMVTRLIVAWWVRATRPKIVPI